MIARCVFVTVTFFFLCRGETVPFCCRSGHEFKLPPLWKRFAAEVLDSFILLFVKLLVTYIAVDFFDIM
uniref:Secreted protein n=1 Tax=Rhipicephalus microplus TaxID=6941 RepID=A0A6M2DBV3_RHIMP